MIKKSYGFVLFFILFLGFMPSCYADDGHVEFLVLADMHVNTEKNAYSMKIEPKDRTKENDADLPIFENMLDIIQEDIKHKTFDFDKKNQPEFILILGDMAGHNRVKDDQKSSEANIFRDISSVYKMVYDKFPGIPIFYVFGNHDSLKGVDKGFYDEDSNVSGGFHSSFEIAINAGTGWKNGFLSTGVFCSSQKSEYPCLIEQYVIDGYYSAYIKPDLRLIALNTVMLSASTKNNASESLANKQIEWLENQLKQARTKSESVLIVSHYPCGENTSTAPKEEKALPYLKQEYQDKVYNLIKDYRNNIVAILSGHSHMEEFKIFLEAHKRTKEMNIIVPAMSTVHGNSPGIKEFYLLDKGNEKGWVLANYETLFFKELTPGSGTLKLNKLYDFVNYYCHSDAKEVDSVGECVDLYITKHGNSSFVKKMELNYTLGNTFISGSSLFKYTENVFVELEKKEMLIKTDDDQVVIGNALNSIMPKKPLSVAADSKRFSMIPWLHLKTCKIFN